MRERGTRIDNFLLTSQPSHGTTIQVTVPIETRRSAHD